MPKDATFSSRIDGTLKKRGESVLSKLGIKPSQALSMFYSQLVLHNGMPFDVRIPNDETIAALSEDLSDANRLSTVDDLFNELDAI